MTNPLDTAWTRLEAGDAAAALRELRSVVDELPATAAAPLVERLAAGAGFEDLAEAAGAVVAAPADGAALYRYGYACVERGASFLAVPPLTEALRLAAEPRGLPARVRGRDEGELRKVLAELATALEDDERHGEAAAVLRRHEAALRDWPERYLLAYNALMAGDQAAARRDFDGLSAPAGPWQPAADRLGRALARADLLGPEALDHRALRAWHFVLTGGVLATLSPYGFAAGMTGRWAFLQDGFTHCRHALERLRVVLDAAGSRPRSVALLPDRSSRALGLAAAELFGLPAAPYRPGTADALVVAYDLGAVDGALVARLVERAPGEVLYEHATCWTDTPAVSADVSGLLGQVVKAPWEQLDGTVDDRPAEELAAEVLAADPTQDEGDGETPADPDGALADFVRSVAARWSAGPRDRCRSSGPVRSSRFR
ncbi:hypothetical protein ACWGB8_02230 [Kitasatospora sp. NPDC054939]